MEKFKTILKEYIYIIQLNYILKYSRIFLNFNRKYNLKPFLTLITFPILVYQIYELVDSYLQFSTEVSVDIISYRDSDNNIALNVLPAITVCNDHIFRELLFNNETKTELKTHSVFIHQNHRNHEICSKN